MPNKRLLQGEEPDSQLAQALGGHAVHKEWEELLLRSTAEKAGEANLAEDWTTQMVTLPEGVGDECVVFSCLRTLQVNYKSAIDLQKEGGTVMGDQPLFGLNLESDGKRRLLLNRWALYTVGSHTARWDKDDKCIRHSFRPFAYVLMRNETTLNITTAIKSLQATAGYLWGPEYNVPFYAGGGDKASVRA